MNAQSKPHVERMAQHPQSPSAKWAKFQADIAKAAVRSADAREQRDRERIDSTDYTRTGRGEPTTGGT